MRQRGLGHDRDGRSKLDGQQATKDVVNRVLARSLLGYDAQEVALSQGLITLTMLPWSP